MTVRAPTFDYTPRDQFLPFHNRQQRWACLVCHRRAGKALDVDTPILKANGEWSTMGRLRPGDTIFDDAGYPTQVIMAHPVMHDRPCYEVVFDDGSKIVADHDHLWHTQTKYDRCNREGRSWDSKNKKRAVGYPAPLPGSVKTTAEIAATLKARGENNHSIRFAKPLQYPRVKLPIDPYVFGLWLGDGHSRGGKFTTADVEIVESLQTFARAVGDHPLYQVKRLESDSKNCGKASV